VGGCSSIITNRREIPSLLMDQGKKSERGGARLPPWQSGYYPIQIGYDSRGDIRKCREGTLSPGESGNFQRSGRGMEKNIGEEGWMPPWA